MENHKVAAPFGPRIYRSTFDKNVLQMLLDISTQARSTAVLNTTGLTSGTHLSLADKRSYEIFYNELKKHLINYIEACKGIRIDYKSFNFDLDANNTMWVNFQRANDFNVLHTHNDTKISVVIYLKIPNELKEELARWDKKYSAGPGMIEYVYGSKNDFCPGTYSFLPEESEIVLFPSYVLHQAYPFTSQVERWSINTNITRFSFQQI